MSQPVTITVELPEGQIEQIARRTLSLVRAELRPPSLSPYMTIPEAAEFLRCRRQRVDDLLCQRRLQRVKDGSRTLIARAELEAYLAGLERAERGGRRSAA